MNETPIIRNLTEFMDFRSPYEEDIHVSILAIRLEE
jgi:hypothetical protein